MDNLLVAGRCLSSEFMAQAGCRLVLTCCNMGQAAGTAAALSLKQNVVPRKINVQELKSQLLKDGCEIGKDLAKAAEIRNSICTKSHG